MTGIQNKPLVDIYKGIREEIQTVIESSEELTEIKSVTYGEKQRIGTLQTPAVWIVPNAYSPALIGGHKAQHDIPFDFVVFVKDLEPERGLQKAQDLALTIYDVLTSDRTLNGLVHDVRPTEVTPSYEAGQSTQLYWAAVQFTFRLQRRE
jgi:hypothetical protein